MQSPGIILHAQQRIGHFKSKIQEFSQNDCIYFILCYFILLHLFYSGDIQLVTTLFSMGAQGSNKIHQKAKTLHIKYTNSKKYMKRNEKKNTSIQYYNTSKIYVTLRYILFKIERLAGSGCLAMTVR